MIREGKRKWMAAVQRNLKVAKKIKASQKNDLLKAEKRWAERGRKS